MKVDLDVGMHSEFERRHLEASILPKDLVDGGQRSSAVDYLSSHGSRYTTVASSCSLLSSTLVCLCLLVIPGLFFY